MVELFKKHFYFIKDLYLEAQSNSVYPFINKIELSELCSRSNLIDDRLNLANCDLLFVSTNTNNKGGIKNKSGLIRHEFLEYLVRLTKFKYIETGMQTKYAEALRIVIE